MIYLTTYLAAVTFFLAVDAIWLKTVMSPLFEARIGQMLRDDLDIAPAAAFYAFYVIGILYFCVFPGVRADNLWVAVGNGVALGFLAYGTYEATNLATLKGWTWTMVMTDVAWGMALTGATAYVGWLVAAKGGFG